ncbi:MAG: undecaprenyl-diphosphate phosphatase [Pseudomonadota bacterium]
MEHLSMLTAVCLGALQGATEFLPVSSSGHLVIVQQLLGISLENGKLLAFDVCLHAGTLAAVIAVFWRDIVQIVTSFFCWKDQPGAASEPGKLTPREGRKLGLLLIIGTLPAVVIAAPFKHFLERMISNATFAACMFLITGVMLWCTRFAPKKDISLSGTKWWHALVIGLMQAVSALFRGISRSGSTISGGLFMGFDRRHAARFAFLLSVPAIGGAVMLQMKDFRLLTSDILPAVIVGTVVSAIVGFACVRWMLAIIQKGNISWFSYYCWAAGIAALVALHVAKI